ncbi:transketolase [Candidatus Berkelbacteria bacterium]|nr:transketolase [Candidatus Berkelbacteria bacterium]
MFLRTNLQELARLIRYYILISSTEAGSGHPSSSLSAVELMTVLMFGGSYKFDLDNPSHPNNDRLIFSKGHASPLFYGLYAAAGKLSEHDLLSYRTFGSPLEGHPTRAFEYTEAATGSLGQGLSIGVGMALNAKYLDKLPYRSFVLLGDSEMAEGSVWEAIQIAAYYKLDNLIAVLDVNRLGQQGETMYGHRIDEYAKRVQSFGWETITVIDGHSIAKIQSAYAKAIKIKGHPVMIIARTIKGKGVTLLENKEGWHGKPVPKEELEHAITGLGKIDMSIRGSVALPANVLPKKLTPHANEALSYPKDIPVATRKAYGNALKRIYRKYPEIVALDGEVSNSTFSEIFEQTHPNHFFEMFIAEQNMVGVALGLSRRGKLPFVSTFAAFFSRAFDQIRMSRYSEGNIKFVGSHAGVSIGEDGASQMGLEDIAIFRTILDSVVLYPADAVATEQLVEQMAAHQGIGYLRTTRKETPIIYQASEQFPIGGSKVLRSSAKDAVTVVAAGITLFEALAAYGELMKQGIAVRVIDCYSIKPIDSATLKKAATETKAIITVEDHYAEGGLGEAVAAALAQVAVPVEILAVRKMPRSGKPDELLNYEDISARAIIEAVKRLA